MAPLHGLASLNRAIIVDQQGIGRVRQAGNRELVGEITRAQLLVAIRQRTVELDTQAGLSKRLLNRHFLAGDDRSGPILWGRDSELRWQSRTRIDQRRLGSIVDRSPCLIQNDEITDIFVEQTERDVV